MIRLDDTGLLSIPDSERPGPIGIERAACAVILLTSIAANGATAFLIILAMTFGLILLRMQLERCLPSSVWTRHRHLADRMRTATKALPA